MASGMKQVETNSYDIQRLLHVKGKRNVVAGEVGTNQGSGHTVSSPPTHCPAWAGGQRLRRGEGQGGGGGEIDG